MKLTRLLPALALAGLIAAPARAETSAEDAKALQAQLHDWLASLLQPAVTVAPDTVQVEPEGDHFRLTLPEPLALIGKGLVQAGTAFTLSARPMDGGRWDLGDLHMPNPMTLTGPNLPAPKAAPGSPPAAPVPNVMQLSLEGLRFHGLLDPSFATTSSFDQSVDGIRITGPMTTTTYGKSSGNTILRPDGTDRITVTTHASLADLQQSADAPNGRHVSLMVGHLQAESALRRLSPTELATIIRTFAALAPTAHGKQESMTPEQRTLARRLVGSVWKLADGGKLSETLEGVTFDSNGVSASLHRLTIGEDFAAPDGKVSFGLQLGLEGIDSPMIPPGIYHDYLPRKISLKPRISGIRSDDLRRLALHAIDTNGKDTDKLQSEATAMLADSPLTVELEEISFDLGPASLDGNLSLEISSPTDMTGDGDITITGLDTLIKRASTTPELKQIAPALIFLKGIGKQDGNDTNFAVSYNNGSLKVNDTDLSSMLPSNQQKK
jgi:hypothetical protein